MCFGFGGGYHMYYLTYLSVTPHNPFVAGEPNIRLLMQYTIEESAAKQDNWLLNIETFNA